VVSKGLIASSGIYFLSLPNQRDKGELNKLFNLMKGYGIKDIVSFQSCAGIRQSNEGPQALRNWLLEFYNPKRPELWSNCQYLYTKTNENGDLVDAKDDLVDQSVVDKLLKHEDGRPLVDLQDKVWTGHENTFIEDHVYMSYLTKSNTVLDYKVSFDNDGENLEKAIPLDYENWNIHWSDGSAGNETMWSLLTSCILRTTCYEKGRRIAIHCWGGYGRTGSAIFLALMLKIIYLHPQNRSYVHKLCIEWFNNISKSEDKMEIKKYVYRLFNKYGIFTDNQLERPNTTEGLKGNYDQILTEINSGNGSGGNGRATHSRAAEVRKRELINSHCLKQRMSFIMKQLLYVIAMFSDDAEGLSSGWNPYIVELYEFLKLNGVIKPKQPVLQNVLQTVPHPLPKNYLPQTVPQTVPEDPIPGTPSSISPSSISPSIPSQREPLGWGEWGMGYLNTIGNRLGAI